MMRVGLDFRPAQKINSRRRGVGRFTRELVQAMLSAASHPDFLVYTLGRQSAGLEGRFLPRPLPHLPKPSRLNWLLELWTFPKAVRKDRLDLFHSLDLLPMPRLDDCPLWVTIHDLIPWIFPEQTARNVPRDFRFALDRALRLAAGADRIITISEHSRTDIQRHLGIPPDRIEVIVEGCHPAMAPRPKVEAQARIHGRSGIESPFLLYVGGADYRKNLPVLLEWFRRVRNLGYRGSLVLAGEAFGSGTPEFGRLQALASRMEIRNQVRMAGYVPDEELPDFYSACDFFVFPSLYEGFGLPVLEAMRCGAPVLASSASSIPEVAGDAAFYFEPTCIEEMVDAFRIASDCPEVVAEKRAIGLQRSRLFTWEAAAAQVLQLYRHRAGAKVGLS